MSDQPSKGDYCVCAGLALAMALAGLGLGALAREVTWGKPVWIWTRVGWVEIK